MDGHPRDSRSARSEAPSSPPADRRAFLAAASAGLAAFLAACDNGKPATRSRTLPAGPPPDDVGAAATKPAVVDEPVKPPPPAPKPLERPLPPTAEPSIRVRLAEVAAPGSVRVGTERGKIRVEAADGSVVSLAGPLVVTQGTDGNWTVGPRKLVAGPLELAPAAGAHLDLDGQAFPGSLRLVPVTTEGMAFDAIVEVPLESYLPGVLAKELFNSWKPETHRAQAVAARSFAICEMHANARRHFDVVAGEASQAWIGKTAHATSVDAVRATHGTVLAWDGRVVPAYYSSCCGGRPASAKDAIRDMAFNAIPPLEATAAGRDDCCEASPNFRWTMALPRSATDARLAGYAAAEWPPIAGLGPLARVEVVDRNAAGRPRIYALVDRAGLRREIPAERLRWAFNFADAKAGPPKGRVKSGDLGVSFSATELSLEGRGFGHGAGMCQYGAEGMARKGANWRRILARYYPGADLAVAYGPK
jgi:stage II sporulation protein D